MLIKLTPETRVIKLFTTAIIAVSPYARVFVNFSHFHAFLIFTDNAKSLVLKM